jgi:hypothetical protein
VTTSLCHSVETKASIAATLAWFVGVPQRIWPQHPIIALAVITVIVDAVVKMSWPPERSRE